MSIIGSNILAGSSGQAGAAGYQIEQSLRFDGSARLNRDTGFSDSSQTWTWSCWAKLCTTGEQVFLSAINAYDSTSGGRYDFATYIGSNFAYIITSTGLGNGDVDQVASPGKYRDTSAWYHFLATSDGTDRILYINGEEVKRVARTANNQYLNQAHPHHIGGYDRVVTSNYYLAEAHFIDGTSYDPDNFGEYDANGVWRPIEVSGLTYGTNGFYLTFDPSATNGIGHDHSGNGNNFTASGFTTSGTGTDVMSDTPTTNYATLNPIFKENTGVAGGTFANGNLEHSEGSANFRHTVSTQALPSSGKVYVEVEADTLASSYGSIFGLMLESRLNSPDSADNFGIYCQSNGTLTIEGSNQGSVSAGDVFSLSVDMDASPIEIVVRKNGTVVGSNPYTLSTTETLFFWSRNIYGSKLIWNFGQRAFEQTQTSGYKTLNTSNLPAPDIADGSKYFNTVLWTGDGASSQTVSGVGFQPDWVWFKSRSLAQPPTVFDAVRTGDKKLRTSSADAENSGQGFSFNSDGWGRSIYDAESNSNGDTYVAWNWKANGSGSSNTDGSITSTVSANPSAGFSIVSYTGTGANATVGHGLGVALSMAIIKRRNVADDWGVYHTSLGNTKYVYLDSTQAANTESTIWNNTSPTSSVFSIGTSAVVNANTGTYIAYCFAEVEGYSKFGSYTGNNSSDGPFVYLGFRPAFLILKSSTSGENWHIKDSTRETYNPIADTLLANGANAELNLTGSIDFLSNGFKIRSNSYSGENSSNTFIYAAFAEHPFGGSGVSPATAR